MTIDSAYFMNFAKCKKNKIDTKFFFAEDVIGTNEAIRYCQDCPVKVPCGQYAMDNNITHGIWGGLSIRARTKIKRERKLNHTIHQ
jgi:WhiB family redox-sensing transcriptional regulator